MRSLIFSSRVAFVSVEEEVQPQPPDFLALAVSDFVIASGVVVTNPVVEDIEFPSNLLCFRREYT